MTNNDMNNPLGRNPTGETSNIERVVMRRVAFIRAVRPFISNGALASYVLVLALYAIGREVWVARVLENAPANLVELPSFYFSAFSHTGLVVQALSIVTLAALVSLARETARLLVSVFTPARA